MTEACYNMLWEFTKEHKSYRSSNPNEPQAVAILDLYQEEAAIPIQLRTAADTEEALQCIRMALLYAI
jgi:hypothetical protein